MFILYAVPIGLVLGWLLGGRLARLEEVRLRWAGVALSGLVVQLALFSGPVAERIGAAGMPVYVGSTALVLAALLRNVRVPGLAVVAVGAVSNLAAIVANGGSMPASPAALSALGKTIGSEYSNSVLGTDPALAPLTDVFAMPGWMPMANVFSIGDVLIGVGVAIAIAVAMRGGASANLPPKYPDPGTHGPWPGEPDDHTVAEKATTAFR
ncbi:MAG TPA: DUF5317 domain-containing protein [Candidatus Limnocylindria bacterium]|nr:DUF5317 domain-containing protein [Candidatus Limnocylindria bacterium]